MAQLQCTKCGKLFRTERGRLWHMTRAHPKTLERSLPPEALRGEPWTVRCPTSGCEEEAEAMLIEEPSVFHYCSKEHLTFTRLHA